MTNRVIPPLFIGQWRILVNERVFSSQNISSLTESKYKGVIPQRDGKQLGYYNVVWPSILLIWFASRSGFPIRNVRRPL